MTVGAALFITARIQPGRYNPGRIETTIGKVEFLSDVKDSLIDNITVNIPLTNLTEDFVLSFMEVIKNHSGNARLFFRVIDPEGHLNLRFRSKAYMVSVDKMMIEFLHSVPGLTYEINA